jgi:hypothetical protein
MFISRKYYVVYVLDQLAVFFFGPAQRLDRTRRPVMS